MPRRRPTTLEPISPAVFVVVSLHIAAALGVWWSFQNVRNSHLAARQRQLAWMNPADFKTVVPPLTVPRAKPAPPAPIAAKPAAAKPAPAPAPAAAAAAEAPVQKATLVSAPPQQHVMEPVANPNSTPLFAPPSPAAKPSANRSITLRRTQERAPTVAGIDSPAPPITSPSLMDIARLNAMRPAVPAPGSLMPVKEEEASMDGIDEAVNTAFLSSWVAPPITSVPENQREARLTISIGKDGTLLKSQMTKFSHSHALDESILEAASKVKKISTSLPSNYTKESYDLELNFLLLP